MDAAYPATYRDARGRVATVLRNDGRVMSVVIRGVEFRGTDFDNLEPHGDADPQRLASFTLQGRLLCSCAIEVEMPMPVVVQGRTEPAVLTARVELGDPVPVKGGLDREAVALALTLGGATYRSRGTSGWFEDELLDLQRQLPPGAYLKACITCAYSDYSPYGHGLFGCMACFRTNKAGYLAVRTKRDVFDVWHTSAGSVQETYLCPEFERRVPGTGYRG